MIEPYKVPVTSTLTDILYAFRKISEQLCEISAKLSDKDTPKEIPSPVTGALHDENDKEGASW